VGWAVFDDENLARNAAMYVEQTTSGVNVMGQRIVYRMLACYRAWSLEKHYQLAESWARQTLLDNAQEFMSLIAPFCANIQGMPVNKKGMFAWFQARNPEHFEAARERAGVLLVTGEACGFNAKDLPGWYRMSMGHTWRYTSYALTALRKELDR
jgi:aspartate/methionine/tyrosine aminotransferase